MSELSAVNKPSKLFKIYMAVILTLIVALLAAILAVMVYSGYKVAQESKTVSTKVASFNKDINTINQNLQNINTQIRLSRSSLPVIP